MPLHDVTNMSLCSTLEAIKNMFTVCYASDITERSQCLLIQFRTVTTTRPTIYWQLTYRSKIIIRIISKPIISKWNQKTMKCVLSVADGSFNKMTIRLVSFHPHPHAETKQSMYVQRNIETRSHYHCCRGEEIITHFESVFYSLSHPTCKRNRRTILSSMACPALPRFSGKEIFNMKCVAIFSTTFRLKHLSF